MKLLHSLGYAFEGLFSCFRTQRNFRIHMLAVIVVTVTGFALHLSGWEWVALVICMASVVALEMINTAIEQLCDLLHPGKHAVIKSVKDISAGAVLVAAGASIITAILIFLPHLS